MNAVGRIFVFLILLMCVVFATFTIMVYATHKNWQDEILRTPADVRGTQTVGWKYRYEELVKENARLTDERNQYESQAKAEKTAKIQALAKAEAVIQQLSKDYATASKQLNDKSRQLESATETLQVTQANLTHATGEVTKLRDDIAAAHAETDAQIKKATAVTDQLTVATGQLEVLSERNQQLSTDVSKANMILKSMGRTLHDPADAKSIRVAGQIRDVSRDKVELSIGMDDGVRIGQELDIYRGDRYVGRVKVLETEPDKAVASIQTEYQQVPVQRGDNVASRL